jgi:tRNA threonylcarbamoyladenosine biosynthesis protein TsaE
MAFEPEHGPISGSCVTASASQAGRRLPPRDAARAQPGFEGVFHPGAADFLDTRGAEGHLNAMRSMFSGSAQRTFAIGEAIGRALFPGAVVALSGDLGAGKTVVAKGIAAGLGVEGVVASPTFVLMQAHEGGRLPLWHADLYRVADADDLITVGLAEAFESGGVVVVEWAERFPDALPADRLDVVITDEGEGRRITVTATGERHRAIEVIDG